MDGIIIIDKPKGCTSFDVVAVMKRLLGTKKVGHSGTLDPLATGVLPILIGRATKAQDILPDSDKGYRAAFRLGLTTDTLDITGEITSKREVNCNEEKLSEKLNAFKGDILQTPPMYSAIKKDGVRLYSLARRGVQVQREKRAVTIRELKLIDFDETKGEAVIDVLCSKGTYIRSLCDDIGNALGCGAVMTELRRTKACSFGEDETITVGEAERLAQIGELESKVRPIQSLFKGYRGISVSQAQAKRFQNGNSLQISRLTGLDLCRENEIIRVNSSTAEFLGLGKIQGDDLVVYKLFKLLTRGQVNDKNHK